MKVNSNLPAMFANKALGQLNVKADNAMKRLSTGIRINKSSDDAAGLAISSKLRAQVRGLGYASRNALDGMSLTQTAEGALSEVHEMLGRIRELSVQAANGTLGAEDRDIIADEINQLMEEVDAVSERSDFNKIKLLSLEDNDVVVQIGANYGQELEINMPKISTSGLGLDGVQGLVRAGSDAAITLLDAAISDVSDARSKLGAYANRLEHTVSNLDGTTINTSQSLSRIFDTDMAFEMSEYTRYNVAAQAATAMLAQANTRPQQMLQLLR